MKTLATTLSGTALTGADFVRAIVALFREKGLNYASFDPKAYDPDLTKDELPWCVFFDNIIDTLSAPALWPKDALLDESDLHRLAEKGFPGRDVVCIAVDDNGCLFYEFFNGDENEPWENLFFDVYDGIRSCDDEEGDFWLDSFISRNPPVC